MQVPAGSGGQVLSRARAKGGVCLIRQRGRSPEGRALEAVTVHVPNDQLGPFIGSLDIPDVQLTVLPVGVLTLRPPASEVDQQVEDVSQRSPLEIYLDGIQAIGSWAGFLGYAATAGVVVWLALYTNTGFLLVGAMLIAPFAGPAMNTAIASARGDFSLLWHSLARYAAALVVTAATTALLSMIYQLQSVTDEMVAVGNVAASAFLLPIAAGTAGALHLAQSQRSSLVSGAGAGMLVAASLAPPAGLVGMAAVLGEWTLVRSALFLLALQLVGINLSGMLIFRLFRLRSEGPRYERGHPLVVATTAVLTAAAMTGLLLWQFGSLPPALQQAEIASRAREITTDVVRADAAARLIGVDATFPRTRVSGRSTVVVTVQALHGSSMPRLSDEQLKQRLTRGILQALGARLAHVEPLVGITVLAADPAVGGR